MTDRYSINPAHALRSEVRRIASAELGRAAAALEAGAAKGDVEAAEKSAFKARKALKRVRALYRLVRSADKKAFSREEQDLAEIGRRLAELRDRSAMAEAASRLATHFSEQSPEAGLLERLMSRITMSSPEDMDNPSILLAECASACRKAALDSHALKAPRRPGAELRVMQAGIEHCMEDAAQRLAVSRATNEAEDWHRFRSRMKQHRLQLRLLQAAWPGEMLLRSEAAARLTDALGEDHDLANLQRFAEMESDAVEWPDGMALLCSMIQSRQRMLREEAERLGSILLAEPASDSARRIIALWSMTVKSAR